MHWDCVLAENHAILLTLRVEEFHSDCGKALKNPSLKTTDLALVLLKWHIRRVTQNEVSLILNLYIKININICTANWKEVKLHSRSRCTIHLHATDHVMYINRPYWLSQFIRDKTRGVEHLICHSKSVVHLEHIKIPRPRLGIFMCSGCTTLFCYMI